MFTEGKNIFNKVVKTEVAFGIMLSLRRAAGTRVLSINAVNPTCVHVQSTVYDVIYFSMLFRVVHRDVHNVD